MPGESGEGPLFELPLAIFIGSGAYHEQVWVKFDLCRSSGYRAPLFLRAGTFPRAAATSRLCPTADEGKRISAPPHHRDGDVAGRPGRARLPLAPQNQSPTCNEA